MTLVHLIFLQPPIDYPGQFPGMVHYPHLNGAMWTIAYEFRCYILIAVLWKLGALQQRRIMLALTILAVLTTIGASAAAVHEKLNFLSDWERPLWITGNLYEGVRFTAAFLFGSSIYLYREQIIPRLTATAAMVSVIVGALLITGHPHITQASLIIFGGFALFWLAIKAPFGRFQRINDKWDISYGTYLYGAPIATYLRWVCPDITAFELGSMTLALALLFGCASYWGVERWAKVRTRKSNVVEANPLNITASSILIPSSKAYSGRI
ncbi:acyltransferase [Sphingomonas paeninsulae]|uniref:Acyltransferase n=1 Tax=Sphingomonas paeninsulae TaxID=2319844 RepID=A0A494T9U1_SPHPE|nr:acyltransferase [Sphingomonas paeninsulae]AYJ85740.1 acyltransferase [Sphingomonas paeninsulae]